MANVCCGIISNACFSLNLDAHLIGSVIYLPPRMESYRIVAIPRRTDR
jgi:hypothetical protein